MKGAVQGVATAVANIPLRKEAAPPLPRTTPAEPRQEDADIEHAEEVEPDQEEKHCRDGDHNGILELESPAKKTPARAQSDEHAREDPERHEHAEGKEQSLTHPSSPLPSSVTHQGEDLQRNDGQNTGHQVENQAAHKRQEERDDERSGSRLRR